MSESENQSEARGDGDENAGRRQLPRGEREWSALLRRADLEAARFLRFYSKSFAKAENADEVESDLDRLDECALAMGWSTVSDDESSDANGTVDGIAPNSEIPPSEGGVPAPSPAAAQTFPDVYSLHNLPECIAIRAICDFARARRDLLLESSFGRKLSARAGTALAETLSMVCRDMMLAVDAEDALEFGLAICLTKKSHAALNRHFAEIADLVGNSDDERGVRAAAELRCALMDLRDICLRILRDSREELEKQK